MGHYIEHFDTPLQVISTGYTPGDAKIRLKFAPAKANLANLG